MAADFSAFVRSRALALTEGSVYERLRRDPAIAFDPALCHGGLIYSAVGARALGDLALAYRRAAGDFPLISLTATWRTSAERIARSAFAGRPVNQDHVAFLRRLHAPYADKVFIGGLLGCRGDAYKPQEALEPDAAVAYHTPQVQALISGQPDFLMAATLPAVSEALGLAKAMAGFPAIVSFVVRPNGAVLDGTPLADAIRRLDDVAAPLGFAINCVHASVAAAALAVLEKTDANLLARVVMVQANTSALSPEELNACATLQTQAPADFAAGLRTLHRRFGLAILGGCCGTDERHIAALAQAVAHNRQPLRLGARKAFRGV